MDATRRKFLGGIALAPIGVHAAAEAAKTSMMTGVSNPIGLASGLSDGVPATANGGSVVFKDFVSWFASHGEETCRQEAANVQGFDPDILEMRLPMATKKRMQIERQYKRSVAEQRTWFDRVLKRDGRVEWW